MGSTEGKEEEGARGRACHGEAQEGEREPLGAVLHFSSRLFASVNLKILFCRETILLLFLIEV